MNVKELKSIKKRIKELQEQIKNAELCACGTAANITNLKNESQKLSAAWNDAMGRLSYDSLEGNEIYLHYVMGYSWKQIANNYDNGTRPDAVRKRCQRYEW